MRVLLTSAGIETDSIKEKFIEMVGKDTSLVKALFVPTAAINPGAIEVLPKCMNDLLKCRIKSENIKVFDLHTGMSFEEIQQFDVVYLCGGDTAYLLERVNATGFGTSLMKYIQANGFVIGVSAGSLIFANNLYGNLGLVNTKLEVHCEEGEQFGKMAYPFKDTMRLTNKCALVIRNFQDGLEII